MLPQGKKAQRQNKSPQHRQGHVLRHIFKTTDRRLRKGEQQSGEREPVRDNVGPRVGHRDGKHQKPQGSAKKPRGARRRHKACDHDPASDEGERCGGEEIS